MSPEQASGQATDQRADIWAFGVCCSRCSRARRFSRASPCRTFSRTCCGREPDWSRLPKDLHPRLRLLLERCLEKKPRNRYSGIADARVDIEAVLADPRGQRRPDVAGGKRASARGGLVLVRLAAAAVVGRGRAWALSPRPAPGPVVRFPLVPPDSQLLAA